MLSRQAEALDHIGFEAGAPQHVASLLIKSNTVQPECFFSASAAQLSAILQWI